MTDDRIDVENGEFFVNGVKGEYKPKDVYWLNGEFFEVLREKDGDCYVSGQLKKGTKSISSKSRRVRSAT